MTDMTATRDATISPRLNVSPEHTAFLFDFDGTLVDIAPTPDSVVVEPGLIETLVKLRDLCGGALAIVTGRPIEQVDHFLPGVPTAVCGEHGVAIRRHPGDPITRCTLPEVPPAWLADAERLVAAWPGSGIERKRAGFVLHYRGAPEAGSSMEAAARSWLEGQSAFQLHPAKMAWEIRPAGIDKGNAVRALMEEAPFAGRRPIFVGDDVTDMDGIRAAESVGGRGFRIPEDFPTPHAFRMWLRHYAEVQAWDV